MSFIYLGSETGFNTLGFLPLLAASLLTRRQYLSAAPKSYFRMGYALGTACEIFSFVFNLDCVVVEALPGSYPVTAENMNYTVIFGVVEIFLTTVGWFFHGKKNYLLLEIDAEDFEEDIDIRQTSQVAPVSKEEGKSV
jgi:hypothetical protein